MANDTTTLPPVAAGSNLIWIFLIWILDFLVVGLSNCIVAFVILRYQALRNRKEYLICGQCFADYLNMLGYIWSESPCSTSSTASDHNNQFSALIKPWECLFGPPTLLWMSAGPVASLMLVTVAIDRCISVSTPLKYFSYKAAYAYRMVAYAYGLGWGMGGLGVLFLFIRNEESALTAAPCYIGLVLLRGTYPLYAFYYLYIASAMGILSVFVYIFVGLKYVYVEHHVVHSHNQSNQGHQQVEREHQRRLTKSLALSGCCTFMLMVIPTLLAQTANMMQWPRLVQQVLWLVPPLNPLCNVIINYKRQPHLRKAFIAAIRNKILPAIVELWT